MPSDTIPFSEYLRDPFEIARDVLLGATLHSRIGGKLCAGKIVELELYMGDCDRACHAYPSRKTPRNAVMFGPGGHAYVYFVYGLHNMFNVVICGADCPNAILIRALEPVAGLDIMAERRGLNLGPSKTMDVRALCSGPAKLTAALGIDMGHNGLDLTSGKKIWISPRDGPAPKIVCGPRIGVDYAGTDAALPWRFAIKDNRFISKQI